MIAFTSDTQVSKGRKAGRKASSPERAPQGVFLRPKTGIITLHVI